MPFWLAGCSGPRKVMSLGPSRTIKSFHFGLHDAGWERQRCRRGRGGQSTRRPYRWQTEEDDGQRRRCEEDAAVEHDAQLHMRSPATPAKRGLGSWARGRRREMEAPGGRAALVPAEAAAEHRVFAASVRRCCVSRPQEQQQQQQRELLQKTQQETSHVDVRDRG